jgi:hypothetical protein
VFEIFIGDPVKFAELISNPVVQHGLLRIGTGIAGGVVGVCLQIGLNMNNGGFRARLAALGLPVAAMLGAWGAHELTGISLPPAELLTAAVGFTLANAAGHLRVQAD